jgi:hypothetical protein
VRRSVKSKKRKLVASKDLKLCGRTPKVIEGRLETYSTDSSRIKWTADQKHFIWTTFKDYHCHTDGDKGGKIADMLILKN